MLEGGMGARPQAEHVRFGYAKRAGVFPSITYSPLGRGGGVEAVYRVRMGWFFVVHTI